MTDAELDQFRTDTDDLPEFTRPRAHAVRKDTQETPSGKFTKFELRDTEENTPLTLPTRAS